jgi:hypothetical protein
VIRARIGVSDPHGRGYAARKPGIGGHSYPDHGRRLRSGRLLRSRDGRRTGRPGSICCSGVGPVQVIIRPSWEQARARCRGDGVGAPCFARDLLSPDADVAGFRGIHAHRGRQADDLLRVVSIVRPPRPPALWNVGPRVRRAPSGMITARPRVAPSSPHYERIVPAQGAGRTGQRRRGPAPYRGAPKR